MTASLAMAAAAFATDIEKRESVGVAPRAELSAALCMAAAGAEVDRCPHWISVMPLVESDAAAIVDDAVRQGNETYKEWVVGLLARLGNGIPGGVYFAGAGVVMCEAGQVADEDVFVLDPVDVDDIVCPEMGFDHVPKSVERLGGDGVWRTVPFVVEPSGLVRLQTTVQPKTPAVFRYRAGTF